MRVDEHGRKRFNRHDYKRGIGQPSDVTCWKCGADLGTTEVRVYEEKGKNAPLIGVLEPGGGKNGVILRVLKLPYYHATVICMECMEEQPNIIVEDWYLDHEAEIEELEEGQDLY